MFSIWRGLGVTVFHFGGVRGGGGARNPHFYVKLSRAIDRQQERWLVGLSDIGKPLEAQAVARCLDDAYPIPKRRRCRQEIFPKEQHGILLSTLVADWHSQGTTATAYRLLVNLCFRGSFLFLVSSGARHVCDRLVRVLWDRTA